MKTTFTSLFVTLAITASLTHPTTASAQNQDPTNLITHIAKREKQLADAKEDLKAQKVVLEAFEKSLSNYIIGRSAARTGTNIVLTASIPAALIGGGTAYFRFLKAMNYSYETFGPTLIALGGTAIASAVTYGGIKLTYSLLESNVDKLIGQVQKAQSDVSSRLLSIEEKSIELESLKKLRGLDDQSLTPSKRLALQIERRKLVLAAAEKDLKAQKEEIESICAQLRSATRNRNIGIGVTIAVGIIGMNIVTKPRPGYLPGLTNGDIFRIVSWVTATNASYGFLISLPGKKIEILERKLVQLKTEVKDRLSKIEKKKNELKALERRKEITDAEEVQ